MWKYRMNLGVRADLPPDGGAAAQSILNLAMDFQ